MGNEMSYDEAGIQELTCRPLQGWAQGKIISVSSEFKESGAGFILDVNDIINLVHVENEDAVQVCKVLSRNVRKDSVNVMTLLAAICFLGEGSKSDKGETLKQLFKLDNDPNSRLSRQETTILIYASSKALCGVLGLGNKSLDLRKARALADEACQLSEELSSTQFINFMKQKGLISDVMLERLNEKTKRPNPQQRESDETANAKQESQQLVNEIAATTSTAEGAATELQELEVNEQALLTRIRENFADAGSNPKATDSKKADERKLVALRKQKAELEKKKLAADAKAAQAKSKHDKKMQNEALKAENAMKKLEDDDRKTREKEEKARLAKEAKEQAKAEKLERARLKKQEKEAKKELLKQQKVEAASQKKQRKEQQEKLKSEMKTRKAELERVRKEEEALRKKLKEEAVARAASGAEETESEKATRLEEEAVIASLAEESSKLASEEVTMEKELVSLVEDDEQLEKAEAMKESELVSQLEQVEREVEADEAATDVELLADAADATRAAEEAMAELQELEVNEQALLSRIRENVADAGSNMKAAAARKKADERRLAALRKQKAELEKKKLAADARKAAAVTRAAAAQANFDKRMQEHRIKAQEQEARAKAKHEKKMQNEALKAEKAMKKLEEDDRKTREKEEIRARELECKTREKEEKARLAKEAKEQAQAHKLERARLKKEEKLAASERKKQEKEAKKELLKQQKLEAAAQKKQRKEQQEKLKSGMKTRKAELERVRKEEEALRKKLKEEAVARVASGAEETESEKATRLEEEAVIASLAEESSKLASEEVTMEKELVSLVEDDEQLEKAEAMKESELVSQLEQVEREVEADEIAVAGAELALNAISDATDAELLAEVADATSAVEGAATELQELEVNEQALLSRIRENVADAGSNPKAAAARKKADERRLAALRKQKAELEKKKLAADARKAAAVTRATAAQAKFDKRMQEQRIKAKEREAQAKAKHEKKMQNEALKAEKAMKKLEEDDRKAREKEEKARLAKEAKEQAKADRLERARLKKEEKLAASERKKQEKEAKKELLKQQKLEAAAQKKQRKEQQEKLKSEMKTRKAELERVRKEEEALRKKLKEEAAARAASGAEETESEKATRLEEEAVIASLAEESSKLASEEVTMEKELVSLVEDDEQLEKAEAMKESELVSQLEQVEREVEADEAAVAGAEQELLSCLAPRARAREERRMREVKQEEERLKALLAPMNADQAKLLSRSKVRAIGKLKRQEEDCLYRLSELKVQLLQKEEARRDEKQNADKEHSEFVALMSAECDGIAQSKIQVAQELESGSLDANAVAKQEAKLSSKQQKVDKITADESRRYQSRLDACIKAAEQDSVLLEEEESKLNDIKRSLIVEKELLEKANTILNAESSMLSDTTLGISYDQITAAQSNRASRAAEQVADTSPGAAFTAGLSVATTVKSKHSSSAEASMDTIRAQNNDKSLPAGYPTNFVENLPAYLRAAKEGKEAFADLLPGHTGEMQRSKKYAQLLKQTAESGVSVMDRATLNTLSKQRRETCIQVNKLNAELEASSQALSIASTKVQELETQLQEKVDDGEILLEAELGKFQEIKKAEQENQNLIAEKLASTKELLSTQEFDIGVQRQIQQDRNEAQRKRRKAGGAALAASRRR